MNYVGGGFIPIIVYSSIAESSLQQNALLTENNFHLLTEGNDYILTEI